MSVASRSLVALPPVEASFENDAALPVSSQSAPPILSRFLMLMVFCGSLANLLVTCLGEQFLSLRIKPSWVTWVCTLASSQVADDESVSWCERRVHAHEFCFAVNEFLLFVVTCQSPLRTVHDTLLEIPIRLRITLTGTVMGARVPASLCPSAEDRFRKRMRINKQIFDIAGGVHVGKDDLDFGASDQRIRLRYARG